MKKGACTPPSSRSFYVLDDITVILLIPELHSILSGLMTCFRWGNFEWYPLCSGVMMILLAGFLQLSMALWMILIGLNIYCLYHKARLYFRRIYLYRRANLLLIQLLFLICTAVCLIAILDYARF